MQQQTLSILKDFLRLCVCANITRFNFQRIIFKSFECFHLLREEVSFFYYRFGVTLSYDGPRVWTVAIRWKGWLVMNYTKINTIHELVRKWFYCILNVSASESLNCDFTFLRFSILSFHLKSIRIVYFASRFQFSLNCNKT